MTTTTKKTILSEIESDSTENKLIEIEPGLTVEDVSNPEDLRFIRAISKFKKLSDKMENGATNDSDALKFIEVLFDFVELLIGTDGLETTEEFFVKKHGAFTADDLSSVISGVLGETFDEDSEKGVAVSKK